MAVEGGEVVGLVVVVGAMVMEMYQQRKDGECPWFPKKKISCGEVAKFPLSLSNVCTKGPSTITSPPRMSKYATKWGEQSLACRSARSLRY